MHVPYSLPVYYKDRFEDGGGTKFSMHVPVFTCSMCSELPANTCTFLINNEPNFTSRSTKAIPVVNLVRLCKFTYFVPAIMILRVCVILLKCWYS
eukprot:SAG31_NODE_8072_length_1528_cov_1.585024_2_plen_95_part_00